MKVNIFSGDRSCTIRIVCPEFGFIEEVVVGQASFSADVLVQLAGELPGNRGARVQIIHEKFYFNEYTTTNCEILDRQLQALTIPIRNMTIQVPEDALTFTSDDGLLVATPAILQIRWMTFPLEKFTLDTQGRCSLQGFPLVPDFPFAEE